jgi:hypothetical protein
MVGEDGGEEFLRRPETIIISRSENQVRIKFTGNNASE